MEHTKRLPNYNLLRKPRNRTIRQLNNIFVVTGIAKNSVEEARRTLESGPRTKLHFTIPSIRDEKVVAARNRTKILSLLEQAINCDLFSQALVPAIAVTEGYLVDMLIMIMKCFPKKLGVREKKIELSLVLEADTLDEVIEKVISNQIHSAFYASPSNYFEYLEEKLSIALPDRYKAEYAEVKATRDIYVHNAGIANSIYVQKAGSLARAADGELLPIDEQYFSLSITCMKGVVQAVYQGLLKKYGKSKELGLFLD